MDAFGRFAQQSGRPFSDVAPSKGLTGSSEAPNKMQEQEEIVNSNKTLEE